ncbi:threonylcarbamoyl-AMP synthase [Kineosporia sp. J2-2]|uniref:L-threonylcarbamoyladenylate synthase n=1 Tax=Kineosporia corallincola TaxID=2835133 RepID=A0ABS5TLU5_9ACTN|nr:L-threonylcarbamoyladenylate synthase [Kineosporia corallincola]MBT0772068.1 threonylcarbamoyl-AMP synthase [Kineosporia corallincola]
MSVRFDCALEVQRSRGITKAADVVAEGDLVVLPTDTVYGIGCDAFDAEAVSALLAAKGRGRAMPPPVLVPHVRTLDGIAAGITPDIRALAEAFWPGALTIITRSQPTLRWDLGETNGTVALRMPLHPVALELLERTGPMAVSSANLTGHDAALTCKQAQDMLGDSVAVYLDGGPADLGVASTIIDCTATPPRVVRQGAVALDDLRSVVPGVLGLGETAPSDTDAESHG